MTFRWIWAAVWLGSLLLPAFNAGSNVEQKETREFPPALAQARQMIVVTTPNWDAVDGVLQRYERASVKQGWQPVGEKIAIVVGRTGLAWGKGLHGDSLSDGPSKKEGDGKSPAGIFRLSAAFGYAAKPKAGAVKLPYLEATPTLECVDDVKSAHYNQVLERGSVKRVDWQSSEQMRRADELYRWGVVVDHNAQREAGCGSCIFLHIWSGAGKGTAGCTAMQAEKMEAVMRWLRGEQGPVLVQLPQAEFARLQAAWRLPNQ